MNGSFLLNAVLLIPAFHDFREVPAPKDTILSELNSGQKVKSLSLKQRLLFRNSMQQAVPTY
jgi:hypothetical protein